MNDQETKPLSKKNAISIYNKLDDAGKKLMEEEFGKEFFSEQEKYDYTAACKKMGYDPASEIPFPEHTDKRHRATNAYSRLFIQREAIGNHPSWNERKWHPRFETTKKGLVFGYSVFESWSSGSCAIVGAPFVFKTQEESDNFAKNNIELYTEIFTHR